MRKLAFVTLLLFAGGRPALAHHSSDAFLRLETNSSGLTLQIDLALKDIEAVLHIDRDLDGILTWDEVRAKELEIAAYVENGVAASAGHKLTLDRGSITQGYHADGPYAVLRYRAPATPSAGEVSIRYSLLFDRDPQHRGVLTFQNGNESSLHLLTPERQATVFALGRPESSGTLLAFVKEGIWHIWIGYDHILFLVSLLLPALFLRSYWRIFGIVTAFTVAHSITLGAATLGIINLPSRLVESAIAAPVFAAALNNLYPFLRREYLVTFIFGLVHGLGFASVLGELELTTSNLVRGLVGFNIGVELGQLAIVAAAIPLAALVQQRPVVRQTLLHGGSALVLAVSSAWFLERAFELRIFGL